MKDTHVLAAACGLALIAIVAVFIGYATDTLPQQKQRVITPVKPATRTPVAKKKKCHCCKVTLEDIRSHLKAVMNKNNPTKTPTHPSIGVSGDSK